MNDNILAKIAEKEAELTELKNTLIKGTNLSDIEKQINDLIKQATIVSDYLEDPFTLQLDNRELEYCPERKAFYSDDYPYWSSSSMSC